MTKSFEIEVYGQRYTIRGEAEEADVQALARLIDERMRTLAAGMKTATATQLAVLTALNLAHELNQALKQQQESLEEADRRADGLIKSIKDTLGGSSSE
ncbi:MAG: cell division protein ZapA [Nitrospirae bacterium]|nr:MAG: cell division protein ZapA [Nitrospirota bacterium]